MVLSELANRIFVLIVSLYNRTAIGDSPPPAYTC